jgi:hypothetical protein
VANRYANLVGANKIKDEWQKINAGFDAVQEDIDNLPVGLYRNAIINGNFDVWQRGTSFTKPNFAYTADRWKVTNIVDDKVLVFRSPDAPNKQSLYSLRVEATESNSGAGASTDISQSIEHYQLFRGKTVTFSGYVYCDPGASFVPNIYDGIANTPGETYTAAAWTKFSVTKPIGESATMLIPYGRFLRSGLSPGKGIYLAQLQLTVSDTALPFQPRSFAEELALCQRYYEKSYNIDTPPGATTDTGVIYGKTEDGAPGSAHVDTVQFRVRKRSTPTVIIYGTGGTPNAVNDETADRSIGAGSFAMPSETGFLMNYTLQNATSGRRWFHYIADAEL